MSNKLQPHTSYIDGQLVQLTGPDNTALAYQYDQTQRTFYIRDGVLGATAKHGSTHIAQDPVPAASCNTPGLMSANDKCKLDAITGTRIGVLGFQGAGFPDDGGWMTGDIIFSAGSDFISLERVGNIIRWVVDVPSPFVCTAEECFQIYWIQDETDVNAIRPPSCGGHLPGVNGYGELKIYLFPESTVINPNSTTDTLAAKGQYPTLIFKRYDDGTGTNEGELDIVLQRNTAGAATVGWTFTPGATGTAECLWYLGTDTSGNRIDFKFSPNSAPGLFGALLYKNNSITKQMAVIIGYSSDVLATNKYKAKFWSLTSQASVGAEISITNLQQWDLTNNVMVTDGVLGSILNVGQFVDVWMVQCGSSPCYYCMEKPAMDVNGLWTTMGAIEFGDELNNGTQESGDTAGEPEHNDVPIIDPSQWGVTNLYDPLLGVDGSDNLVPLTGQANYTSTVVHTTGAVERKYLEIVDDDIDISAINAQRPVFIWHRASLRNALIDIYMARPIVPTSGLIYPPVDVLLRAPVSTVDSRYALITAKGTFASGVYAGYGYVKLVGPTWNDYPPRGMIKVTNHNGSYTYGQTMSYIAKVMNFTGDSIYLVTTETTPNAGSQVEILHEEYTTPAVRLQFLHNTDGHDIEVTPLVGTLDMAVDYGSESGANYIRDFSSYEAGPTYWQDGSPETSSAGAVTSTEGFYILNGGIVSGVEYYNTLRVMVIENQVWMWWNNLLVPTASGNPFFEITDVVKYGKFGLRLWPGSRVRRVVVRSKLFQFSQYSLGQLELS